MHLCYNSFHPSIWSKWNNMKTISKENNNKNIKAPKKSLLMNIDKKSVSGSYDTHM